MENADLGKHSLFPNRTGFSHKTSHLSH